MIRLAKALARRILGKELRLLESTIKQAESEVIVLSSELAAAKRYNVIKKDQEVEELYIRIRQQQKEIDSLSKAPTIEYRITREFYEKEVVSKLETPLINSSVTPQQAHYLLGIQRALRVFEKIVV